MKTIALMTAVALILPLSLAAGNLLDGSARGGATLLTQRPVSPPVPGYAAHTLAGNHPAACADCHTVTSAGSVSNGKMGQVRTVALEKHLCGDCSTSTDVSGHGKAKPSTAVHTCAAPAARTNCCAK